MPEQTPCARPCATCPWLVKNHNAAHPSDATPAVKQEYQWYSTKNLRRLWCGLASGDAPGMICHATDPEAAEYGGKSVAPGHERECVGVLILVMRSFARLEQVPFPEYRRGVGIRMSKSAMRFWVGRMMFRSPASTLPQQVGSDDPVGVPWDDDVLNIVAQEAA